MKTHRPIPTHALLLAVAACLAPVTANAQAGARAQDASATPAAQAPTLDETRLTMSKWTETQQVISKERKDWAQRKDVITSRLDLTTQEITTLDEKIAQAEASVATANEKRAALVAENDELKAASTLLADGATKLEGEIKSLYKSLPQPLQQKIQPFYTRIPEDPATTRASVAERYQNILGILADLDKSNREVTVSYEVRELSTGQPAEVKVIYVGLAQAYYVSARGESGIGYPTADGWKWQASNAVSNDVLSALEIMQGKQSPAFVPLPVRLQ